ncbi:MAG: type II secretion system minor pseudopilin GspJ [gamma proteobacterium symbiont of Bathyaustriella thionipta]|nr:type II secretion system minor pseudopilin GspJ [gamma proteobacterium symbiont of Bathyaustriella thionipta]
MSTQREQGFTLLELLIAMSIFAILAAMGYVGLQQMIRASEQNAQAGQQLQRLQKAMFWLTSDVAQILPRPVRDRFGDTQAALLLDVSDGTRLSLTRAHAISQQSSASDGLQRVNWWLQDGQLMRQYRNQLDVADQPAGQPKVLLQGVQSFEVRVLDERWTFGWPLNDGEEQRLPRAIEITLELDHLGQIQRLFRLPQS